MKRLAIVLAFVVLCVGSLWLRKYQMEPTHGTKLATVDGVDIYYHRGPSQRGKFGLEYECVEFVNRWLVAHGHRNLVKTGHAISYYYEAKAKGLTPYTNGSVKPQRGDVIVFTSSMQPYGHVGIVVEVDADSVLVTQQNATMRLWPLVKPLPLERFTLTNVGDKWTVANRWPLTCVGWSRR